MDWMRTKSAIKRKIHMGHTVVTKISMTWMKHATQFYACES